MAGVVYSFSLLTGFSIGLFLLPIVVVALYGAARVAPDFRASLGLLAGIGLTLLGVASIHNFSAGWLISGAAFGAVALGSFMTTQGVRRRAP